MASTDATLVERLPFDRSGAELRELYRRYSGELFGFATSALGDRELAEEVVQDVFAQLWRPAESYDGRRASVRTWLYAIARNRIIDAHRRAAGNGEEPDVVRATAPPAHPRRDGGRAMTGCRSHGELIGPYVLGALEPSEMDEIRRHLATCERCAAEERALAGVPALLDHAQAEHALADTALPAPSPALEDAVLDRFVRDRAAAAHPRARRRWRPLAAAAGLAAALLLVLLVLWPG